MSRPARRRTHLDAGQGGDACPALAAVVLVLPRARPYFFPDPAVLLPSPES